MKYSREKLNEIHVKQLGEFACGLACLSAVARYHGGDVSQEKLRNVSGTTLNGTSLLGLYEAAKEIGLDAGAFEANFNSLRELDHPVILHVVIDGKQEHFVVCYGVEDDMFIIGDPAWGITPMSEAELAAIWRSKALLSVQPGEKFVTKQGDRRNRWDWLKSLLKEDMSILTVAGVIGIVMAALGLTTAIFSQKLIDDFLPNKDMDKIFIGFGALLFLLIGRSLLGLIRGILMVRQGRDLNVRIIKAFLQKVIRLPIAFFNGYSSGDLIARMNDSLRIRNSIALITGNVVINVLVVFISCIYLFFISGLVGALSLSSIVIFLVIAWKYHPAIRLKQKEIMAAHSANETQYIDVLSGIGTVKSYGKEDAFEDRINMVYGLYQNKGYELGLVGNRFDFVTQLTVSIYITGIFALGVWKVLDGSMQLGEMVAMTTIGGSMIPSLAGLMIANIQVQEARTAFNRMHELANLETENLDEANVSESSAGSEEVLAVKDLTFRFPGRRPLLHALNLSIPRGKTVALFGEIGSGKSTLVDLIQRYYPIERGQLTLDGSSTAKLSIQDWRTQISVVAQREKIFNSSVIDNICLSNDPNEVERCISFISDGALGSFFEGLPQGYLTLCGEDGKNLSGGQKQLIAIARALYKQPSYLILDESTSAMDQKTEHTVISFLRHFAKQKKIGVLIITHRLSLARQSDHIFLLSDGCINQCGTHDELIRGNNAYQEAYEHLTGISVNEELLN